MVRIILFFLIVFMSSAGNFNAQEKVDFEFDYARYNYDSTASNLEIYYSIGQKKLLVVEEDGKKVVKVNLNIKITNKETKELILNKKYQVSTDVSGPDSLRKNENLIGVLPYLLPVGTYYIELTAQDGSDTSSSKYLNEEIEIFPYAGNSMTLSDIEFASRIIQQSQNPKSIFYKNTLEVIPNPVGVYGMNMPMLFYYAELYNLTSDTTGGDFLLNTQVLNSYGGKMFEKSRKISKANNSIVEVGVVNTSKYPSGTYSLFINLIYANQNFGVSSQKRFFVVNPHIEDTLAGTAGNMNIVTSEFGVMNEEDCENLFNGIKHITSSNDIDQYESLNSLEAQREFLFNFFAARDPNPATPINEFKEEYFKRIETVEARYKTFTRKGVKTDRGRIFLTFGEPDEIEYHPNDYNSKPYEIWYYNSVEGGVYFVFGDLTGYSDYELLHSTKRGELRDDNWQRRIQAN